MTPKKLLNKLQAEATTEIGKARYEGALAIHNVYLAKQRRWNETHREELRKYNREYMRKRRAEQRNNPERIAEEVENII